MKVLLKGTMPNGTEIQIEEWNENYNFMPYGSTIASYPKSKMSHEGAFAPKGNMIYRFDLTFGSFEECKTAFENLINGKTVLSDYRDKMYYKKYADCV